MKLNIARTTASALGQQPAVGYAGIDEVGRGAWAGPVVAAAVVLNQPVAGIKDSKQLSPAARARLSEQIQQHSQWAIGQASVAEINQLDILRATFLAMERAVAQLQPQPQQLWVDGHLIPPAFAKFAAYAVIAGDQWLDAISAASIVAKVARDNLMLNLSADYPGYGFERHKGYGTAAHLRALQQLKACPHHRHFKPVLPFLSQPTEATLFEGLGRQ